VSIETQNGYGARRDVRLWLTSMKKAAMGGLFLAMAVFLLLAAGPGLVEGRLNRVHSTVTRVSDRAEELHHQIFIADLHADTLLWNRDLLEESDRGHVDVPRLLKGNVALQVFSVVTKAPWGINMTRNADTSDLVLPLAILQRWPRRTWHNLKERALFQAQWFATAAAASRGRFVWIKNAADLRDYLERRRRGTPMTAGLLAIEGAQALDGDPANLQTLFDAGFRMMSLTHFTDNSFAGSATGVKKGGLTESGRALVKAMESRGMIVDLAHTSPQTVDDVLAIATRPVVVSHTGVSATCASNRNLTDDQVGRIAEAGGLIGIAYFQAAVCGADARAIARAIRHAATVAGVEHVALGSDFDGATAAPFDAAGLAAVTDALISEGFQNDEIAQIMGGSVERFLLANLR